MQGIFIQLNKQYDVFDILLLMVSTAKLSMPLKRLLPELQKVLYSTKPNLCLYC